MSILNSDNFKHHVDYFNDMEPETVVNLVPNSQSWDWMKQNTPLFSCPDESLEQMYYFRWWVYRKHITQTPVGTVITEFLTAVKHAGAYNSISCALGHHIAEGRWIRTAKYLDEYVRFWFRGNDGKPMPKFHNYSSWAASAIYDRYLATGDHHQMLELFDDLVSDYRTWEQEKQLPNGLFWQFDVRDGMEESISGSRKDKNARPTINSYMWGNAIAIAEIAKEMGRADIETEFSAKAAQIKSLVQQHLWDDSARFYKAQTGAAGLCESREELGLIPWYFNLPDEGYQDAWKQVLDPQGFWAPFGFTTAERRSPQFRTHGVGECEWDGSVWPFANSQTLNAMANVIRRYKDPPVDREHYLQAMQIYTKAQHWVEIPPALAAKIHDVVSPTTQAAIAAKFGSPIGKPYLGEYLDETNGAWLKGDNPRSRYYNHSTFCDLVIAGLAGLVPRADDTIEISPMLPAGAWDWFGLQDVPYHGRLLTIVWDRDGSHFNSGTGLTILVNGRSVANAKDLGPLIAKDALRGQT